MRLKAVIKNISKDKHISAQLVMQNFMLERLLERISVFTYNLGQKSYKLMSMVKKFLRTIGSCCEFLYESMATVRYIGL